MSRSSRRCVRVCRVLKPGGSLHLLDFGQGGSHSHNPLARCLHSSKRLQDNRSEQILTWMGEAALVEPEVVDSAQPIYRRIAYILAPTPTHSPPPALHPTSTSSF